MSVALLRQCVLLLALVALPHAQAKIVQVSGQVVNMNSGLPDNTWSAAPGSYSYQPADIASPSINGSIALGVFDEQQGVILTSVQANSFTLADGSHLTAGVAYDAFYIYGHVTRATYLASPSTTYFASGTVTTDNLVIGCTTSDSADLASIQEIASAPYFALSTVYYQNVSQTGRGFEAGDFGVAFGTTLTLTNTWTWPGDYDRCFSISCSTCTCQVSATLANPNFCLGSSSVTLQQSALSTSFSSSCSTVSADSFYAAFTGAGAAADGKSITIAPGTSSINVALTAGCGCDETVTIPIPACGASSGCPGCPVAHRAGCDVASASSTGNCVSMDFASAPTDSCTSAN
uniref:Predicted protein n=1 Tax=Hordeum vulgare subsp. vulgare TaxID=112509 RepID=F2E3Z4_HORVV|nr:predicted protein [Hordeum vulgare subsp. vulgare]